MKTRHFAPAFAMLLIAGNAVALFSPAPAAIEGARSDLAARMMAYADARVASLDPADDQETAEAAIDIQTRTRENVTAIRDSLRTAGGASALVRETYKHATGLNAAGTRTNLTEAWDPIPTNALYKATLALYAQRGIALTAAEEAGIQQQAALVPAEAARAGAILIYAVIDAESYRQRALRALNESALGDTLDADGVVRSLHRHANLSNAAGNPNLDMSAEDIARLEKARDAAQRVAGVEFARGMDVLSQALDEVQTLNLGVPMPGMVNAPACSNKRVLFAPGIVPDRPELRFLNCIVVLGGTDDNAYYNFGETSGPNRNVLLADFGGRDTYGHRQGGGYVGVQMNIDLGSGDDHYVPDNAVVGVAQGAGHRGIGLLFDQAGNDTYHARGASFSSAEPFFVAQGGGYLGAGMLLDNAGNDAYRVTQGERNARSNAQGVALMQGYGVLRDLSGSDTYTFELQPEEVGVVVNGGGAQGFASLNSSAYLLDYGSGNDLYTAGQDLVQAAASLSAFALLHDEGGDNTFRAVSSQGCPRMSNGACRDGAPNDAFIVGWSQGYADSSGTAVLLTGPGADDFNVTFATLPPGEYEGRAMLSSAFALGFAVLIDENGQDKYDARALGLGYADGGMSVFTDGNGPDTYRCYDTTTCYGVGVNTGLGIWRDITLDGGEDESPVQDTRPVSLRDLNMNMD